MPQVKILFENTIELPPFLQGAEVQPASVIETELSDEQIAQLKEHLETQAKEGKGNGAIVPVKGF